MQFEHHALEMQGKRTNYDYWLPVLYTPEARYRVNAGAGQQTWWANNESYSNRVFPKDMHVCQKLGPLIVSGILTILGKSSTILSAHWAITSLLIPSSAYPSSNRITSLIYMDCFRRVPPLRVRICIIRKSKHGWSLILIPWNIAEAPLQKFNMTLHVRTYLQMYEIRIQIILRAYWGKIYFVESLDSMVCK